MDDLIRRQVTLIAFDDTTFTYNEIRRRLLLVLSPQSHLKAERIDAFNECAAAVKRTNLEGKHERYNQQTGGDSVNHWIQRRGGQKRCKATVDTDATRTAING